MGKKLTVLDTEINVVKINEDDYICLTDMMKAKDGDFFVTDWLRNRNTLEYLGIWERIYNPDFNYGEFAIIRNQSGLNRFKISVKEFVEKNKCNRSYGQSRTLWGNVCTQRHCFTSVS